MLWPVVLGDVPSHDEDCVADSGRITMFMSESEWTSTFVRCSRDVYAANRAMIDVVVCVMARAQV